MPWQSLQAYPWALRRLTNIVAPAMIATAKAIQGAKIASLFGGEVSPPTPGGGGDGGGATSVK